MRKLLTVTLALVFVLGLSGLAFAGNTAHTVKTAGTYNYAYIDQTGGDYNLLDSDQLAVTNYNELRVGQQGDSNKALLTQVAYGYNYAKIVQLDGHNWLGRSGSCGISNYTKKAFQWSHNSFNKLLLYQQGGGNKVALYQDGADYNLADIDQRGSGNEVKAYQFNTGGFNNLYVRQTSGDFARVCDTAGSNNDTTVLQ